ncbi:MAG: hypothetical protein ACUVWJ_08990 [Spirochaetota bacterium]
MDIFLSEGEINAIKTWADNTIHGGHWGDGDFMVPEEEIILKKINNMKDNTLNLTEQEAMIILGWSDSTYGIHTMEEDSVLRKLKSLIWKRPQS